MATPVTVVTPVMVAVTSPMIAAALVTAPALPAMVPVKTANGSGGSSSVNGSRDGSDDDAGVGGDTSCGHIRHGSEATTVAPAVAVIASITTAAAVAAPVMTVTDGRHDSSGGGGGSGGNGTKTVGGRDGLRHSAGTGGGNGYTGNRGDPHDNAAEAAVVAMASVVIVRWSP